MVQAKFYMSDVIACGCIRGEAPAALLNKGDEVRVDVKTGMSQSDFPRTDVMVFQRQVQPQVLEEVRRARSQGIRTVYDIDDDVLNTPREFVKPFQFYSDPSVRSSILTFFQTVDEIWASTQAMKDAVDKYTAGQTPCKVVPNYVDVFSWQQAYALHETNQSDMVTIGWMASGSHAIDAPLVHDALLKILEKYPNVRMHFIGWVGFAELPGLEAFKDRVRVDPWIGLGQLPFAMSSWDIGLCPLVDNQFNRCKSAIKCLQYASFGCVPVMSPLPLYREVAGPEGVYAEGNWFEVLERLVRDPAERRTWGQGIRNHVLENWSLAGNLGTWAEAYENVAKKT